MPQAGVENKYGQVITITTAGNDLLPEIKTDISIIGRLPGEVFAAVATQKAKLATLHPGATIESSQNLYLVTIDPSRVPHTQWSLIPSPTQVGPAIFE